MAIGCKIIRDFPRPDTALVERFRGIPVSDLDDCMGRTAAADAAIRPLNKGQLLGCAFTVKLPEGDNLMFHAALDIAKPGDVIVVDAGGRTERAMFGDLLVIYSKARGIKGIVCDGAVRDKEGIEAVEDFHVYARGFTPNGPYKNGPGEINVPVVIGGRVVRPGDIVVGDADGIIFISPEIASQVAEAALAVGDKEKKSLEKIASGTFTRPWVAEKLREIDCEII